MEVLIYIGAAVLGAFVLYLIVKSIIESIKRKQFRNKERRDEAVANGRCPRCGGSLILRNGRYGQFYGCSNYPQCNYVLCKE